MSEPLFGADDDANTPLTPEEREELIPTYIAIRAELNEAEQINITKAVRWLARARVVDILDDAVLRDLHRRMFDDVWKWAGRYRTTARNTGIDAYRIGTEVRQLLGDVRYWVENNTFGIDETAIRFSHRLVAIHPFPNGNGRLSRLAADMLAMKQGRPRFTWGRANLIDADTTRCAYVEALRHADRGEIELLLKFARD